MNGAARILAALLALGVCQGTNAAPPSSGQWQGVIHNGPSIIIPVTLTIASANSGSLQFGAPVQCRLNLAFVAERPDGWIYKLDSPYGGSFCDRLHGGDGQFERSADGKMRSFLRSPHGTQQFLLTPVTPR